jgi:proline iminopeptidase
VEAVHQVAASFRDAQVVVLPGAGHFPWVDEPEAFAGAVETFLSTLPS